MRDQVPPQRERPAGAEPPLSDTELVARVRGGDDGAYEELYRRHAAAVRRYARGCCRDAHTAEDLTGEVFARTLQAIRGGSGPESAVRAYLLTTVRRAAAGWGDTAKREQLVEDFALFATSAAFAASPAGGEAAAAGAEVRAMHDADQSLAMRAFRTLPERWQAVLWHTAVEDESPSKVAPLLGLTPNATAVLAHRAREGLRQAYLQAHVNAALTAEGGCGRYADRLGAHARGGLRLRADRELRGHLAECGRCRAAAADLADINACLKSVLPVATVGWFAAGYVAKAAAVAAGAAAVGGGAAIGAGVGIGVAGGAAATEALGLPVKLGIAAGVLVTGAGAALAISLLQGGHHAARPLAAPPAASAPARSVPHRPAPRPTPTPAAPPSASPSPSPTAVPARPVAARPAPEPTTRPRPTPTPTPSPAPTEPGPPARHTYRLDALPVGRFADPDEPFVRLSLIDWFWHRDGLAIDGVPFTDGVSVHAPSVLTVGLRHGCVSYDAFAGPDDLAGGAGPARSVVFLVYGDRTLLVSRTVAAGAAPARIHADLAGRRLLRLVVRGAGGDSLLGLADWADWADASLTCD